MKKIKEENIKIGEFICIVEKPYKKVSLNRRFMLNILSKNNRGLWNVYFCSLQEGDKKTSNFNPLQHKGNYNMLEEDWRRHEAYKLNKNEVSKFKKSIILRDL